jgi:hypothetical protein
MYRLGRVVVKAIVLKPKWFYPFPVFLSNHCVSSTCDDITK